MALFVNRSVFARIHICSYFSQHSLLWSKQVFKGKSCMRHFLFPFFNARCRDLNQSVPKMTRTLSIIAPSHYTKGNSTSLSEIDKGNHLLLIISCILSNELKLPLLLIIPKTQKQPTAVSGGWHFFSCYVILT